MLSNADHQYVLEIFERIRTSFKVSKIKNMHGEKDVTFSMGVAVLDLENDKSRSQLITRADKKLYVAKQNGRNKVEF